MAKNRGGREFSLLYRAQTVCVLGALTALIVAVADAFLPGTKLTDTFFGSAVPHLLLAGVYWFIAPAVYRLLDGKRNTAASQTEPTGGQDR